MCVVCVLLVVLLCLFLMFLQQVMFLLVLIILVVILWVWVGWMWLLWVEVVNSIGGQVLLVLNRWYGEKVLMNDQLVVFGLLYLVIQDVLVSRWLQCFMFSSGICMIMVLNSLGYWVSMLLVSRLLLLLFCMFRCLVEVILWLIRLWVIVVMFLYVL